jgi:hypothetical protein
VKNKLTYNTIPHQNKQTSNSLTIAEWNAIINVLRIQTNNIVDYLNILQEEIVRVGDIVARARADEYGNNIAETYVPKDNAFVKYIVDSTSVVIEHTLVNEQDVTYSADDIESVVLTIPPTEHGFYSSITFKNTISASLSVVNNSDLPVMYIKNAVAVNVMTLDANTRNNLLIYNDGININIIQLRVEL